MADEMAMSELVVLIPESTRKRAGGDTQIQPVDTFVDSLPAPERRTLAGLRREILERSKEGDVAAGGLLPAYRRFDGNMYRRIPRESWEHPSDGVEVLIASGLLGLIASRDTIPAYNHSMAEPMPPFGKLNRWWNDRGLPGILKAWLGAVRPAITVDLLSLEYREAVAGYAEGIGGIRVKTIDFPGMGRGSQPRRGNLVAKILRTGKV